MQATLSDLVHTGPGTLAGRYMRSFWQPVRRSEDVVAGTAKPLRILGEDFTIYRGQSGQAHVVAPRCPHRLTRLHLGWVEDDDIRCRYHGWKFDATGQCIYQPGEREAFTKGTRIKAYPTQEYLGLVWAYFGEGDPPPMRRYPDFERKGILSVSPPEVWPCNYFNRLDNGPDLYHVLYTHKETFSREGSIAPPGIDGAATVQLTAAETEFGIESELRGIGQGVSYFHFLMPNTNAIAAHVGRVEADRTARHWRAEMFIRVPVDDTSSISFPIMLVDIDPDSEEAKHFFEVRDRVRAELNPEALIAQNSEAVLAGEMSIDQMDPRMNSYYSFLVEDYACQVGQGPIANRVDERLGQIDQGTVLLRKLWLRELTAFAEGRPTKQWVVPAGLADKTQPQPSLAARRQAAADVA
jgi:5,5'-dehydrodivanillate O-demethylase